jgi:hypothetical protein
MDCPLSSRSVQFVLFIKQTINYNEVYILILNIQLCKKKIKRYKL